MYRRSSEIFSLITIFTLSVFAANDPFVGKWQPNFQKSKLTGEVRVIQDLGGNKYKLTFGAESETIVADGTDQPANFGRTISLQKEGGNAWRMVVKKDGRTMATETLQISDDGKTLTLHVSGTFPSGTEFSDEFTDRRIAGGPGLAGTWESSKTQINAPEEWDIEAFEGDGLSFIVPAEKDTLSVKFDRKDYPEKGPNVPEGSTTSGKRVNARTLELTDKVNGKVVDTAQLKVSADDKTLTQTIHNAGQKKVLVVVYDRQ